MDLTEPGGGPPETRSPPRRLVVQSMAHAGVLANLPRSASPLVDSRDEDSDDDEEDDDVLHENDDEEDDVPSTPDCLANPPSFGSRKRPAAGMEEPEMDVSEAPVVDDTSGKDEAAAPKVLDDDPSDDDDPDDDVVAYVDEEE
jgi:hypothetical protein